MITRVASFITLYVSECSCFRPADEYFPWPLGRLRIILTCLTKWQIFASPFRKESHSNWGWSPAQMAFRPGIFYRALIMKISSISSWIRAGIDLSANWSSLAR